MFQRITAAVGAVFLAGCSVFGIRSGTEQPAYDVVGRVGDDIEIRRYGERLAAEVSVSAGDEATARNNAFRILAGYIFGANRAAAEIAMTAPVSIDRQSEEIAMTAPVETSMSDDRLTMRFFLPAEYRRDTVPEPIDPRVSIVDVAPETVAALRFTGSTDPAEVVDRQAGLLRALGATTWQPVAAPVAYFYDPPWTIPFLRRNEVVVRVEAQSTN